MALEQKLSLKLAQKLVMTPSLQQAIKLLQMTRLELQGVLAQELVENPVLEETAEADDEETPKEAATETAEVGEANSMENIDFDAYFGDYMESSGYASVYEERQAAPLENTLTRDPDLYDYLVWQLQMLELEPRLRQGAELIIGNLDTDGFLVASLEELCSMEPPDGPAIELRADGTYFSHEEMERALTVVRSLDPPGIGCENLRESLLYQLEECRRRAEDPDALELAAAADWAATELAATEMTAAALEPADEALVETELETGPGAAEERIDPQAAEEAQAAGAEAGFESTTAVEDSLETDLSPYGLARWILEGHWDVFMKRQFQALAKELGMDLDTLKPAVDMIRSLDPHPGRRFSSERPQYVEADVTVIKVGGEYVIQLDDDGMPRLRISKAYRKMLRSMKAEGNHADAQQYIKDKMRSALWLIKSLDQRQRTIYKVAESLIRQQREFLDRGIEHLRPMVLRDVAEDIGMHESTVSRVVANKYIHTPRGLLPLKFFFHSGIDRDYGENISSLTVKRRIQQLVQEENPKKPLSDSELMRILKRDGIQIARRTVAKYRDELSIPSSTDRKKVF